MTAAMKNRAGFHARKAGIVTPLLRFLAGTHAEQIAHIWPAPHEDFFALPAARRHAAAMLINRMGEVDFTILRRIVERAKDSRLAHELADGSDLPGLMKALAKMGEVLWEERDYRTFLALFAEPNSARVLRHMEALTPGSFAPLSALPKLLRETAVLACVKNLPAAIDLASAFDLVVRIRGEAAVPKVVRRWVRASDTRRLFEMAIEDLSPDIFRQPEPAPSLNAPFHKVTTRKQLEAAAQEFQNCLRDFTNDIAIGRMVVFIWRGQPDAAVALNWDAAGWRLAEAESKGNAGLPEPALRDIAIAVEKAGGRLGPAVGTLIKRLHQRGYGDASADPPGHTWIDRLELGDLWD